MLFWPVMSISMLGIVEGLRWRRQGEDVAPARAPQDEECSAGWRWHPEKVDDPHASLTEGWGLACMQLS